MNSFKKILKRVLIIVACVYASICIAMYFMQEKIIFHPEQLPRDYKFQYANCTELNMRAKDGTILNSLLFMTDSAKGVILYLHGNAGSLRTWGDVAETYTSLHYDVLITDYRGFGKSEGSISSQGTLFSDIDLLYDTLKNMYGEEKIIVLGYSIGTGPAARAASVHHPRMLILQAPYYSLTDMMRRQFPILPPFVLKYPFSTNEYLKECTMPVVIFHGDADEVIPYNSSLELKKLFKPADTLITLPGWGHNGMGDCPVYEDHIKTILQ